MNKPDVSVRKWDAIYKILDSLFSVAVLPFAIYALFTRGTDDPTKDRLYSAAFFFVFSLSFVCQALRKKNRSEKYTWQLIQAGVYLVSVILILAVPDSSDSLPIITIQFAVMMILNRVLSIVKNPLTAIFSFTCHGSDPYRQPFFFRHGYENTLKGYTENICGGCAVRPDPVHGCFLIYVSRG